MIGASNYLRIVASGPFIPPLCLTQHGRILKYIELAKSLLTCNNKVFYHMRSEWPTLWRIFLFFHQINKAFPWNRPFATKKSVLVTEWKLSFKGIIHYSRWETFMSLEAGYLLMQQIARLISRLHDLFWKVNN